MSTVRDLLQAGTFHQASVEEIADAAGVSRASLYQHFGSRMGLIDAICSTMDENEELKVVRESMGLSDLGAAFDETIRHVVRFWVAEEMLHRQLYGVAEVDTAAQGFIARQTDDRRQALSYLLSRFDRESIESDALPLLLVATSFHTYMELKHNSGMSSEAIEGEMLRLARFAIGEKQR